MYQKILISLISLLSFSIYGAATIDMLPIANVYAPMGFDSNDSVEIVVEGFLPNLCYKAPLAKVKVFDKEKKILIEIKGSNYVKMAKFCPEVIVPFVETVSIGKISHGDYQIIVNQKSPFEISSKISIIDSSSSAIDENIYANIHAVERVEGEQKVILKGYNPSDCFVKDEVSIISNGVDTYSIMPRMKQIRNFCPMKMVPVEFEVKIPSDIKRSKILLHVRVMNGKSVNSIFTNY
ncbi:MAG: hypothetical protein HON90_14400 [Halobacteriovoraceae bacterium]|mgnify:CR=1 FL=1|jgi:hypothetical protein|nr:hypothetical protein [Halobacteriovoraceae bacterium]